MHFFATNVNYTKVGFLYGFQYTYMRFMEYNVLTFLILLSGNPWAGR